MLHDIEKLARQIDRKGTTVKYYQGTLCSCVIASGHPDPKCDCHNGFRYQDPVQYKILRTAVSFKGLPERIAVILQGGCTLTIPSKYYDPEMEEYYDCDLFHRVTRGDVFVVTNRKRRDRDILTKGVRDWLMAFDVQKVYSIMSKGTTYVQGIDFNLDKTNRQITWLGGGNSPTDEEAYTVEFECLIQYIVYADLGMDRGGDSEVLPKRILCPLRQYINFEPHPLDTLSIE